METVDLPVNVRRYGVPNALPETIELRAGPLTMTLENADLRGIRFGDVEIVQRLYVAIRNQNWDTIPAEYSRMTVHNRGDSFEIGFEAANRSGGVDFAWSGSIVGTADGRITYRMDGAPRTRFLRNRIGFCVLHPMTVAGLPAMVTTPAGTAEGVFPELISPHQPFIDMVSISHPVAPGSEATVTIAFEGDLFEMEDQRNWTDASFKTYSTPLRIPYPVEVTPDDRITQIVTISVVGEPPVQVGGADRPDIKIDFDQQQALPAIGFGAGRKTIEDEQTLARLKALAPDHLLADLDLAWEDGKWQRRLGNAAANATALDTVLDLSVIAGADESSWSDLAAEIASNGYPVRQVFVFPAPDDPVTFPRPDLVTHESTARAARAAFSDSDVRISGGTRAYFTELNRGIDLVPLGDIDGVMFTVTPEVHAFDNRSLVENIAAQTVAVNSARALVGDKPLTVGPITLKPPYNPNATSAPPKAGPDRLPDEVDPRQLSLFAAGWTIGSLRALLEGGVDAVTYYELAGWRGLIEKTEELTRRELFPTVPGGIFPVYHVFAAIAGFGPAQAARVEPADLLGTEGFALIAGDRVRILLANLTNSDREVVVETAPLREAQARYLDEASYVEAIDQPEALLSGGEPISAGDGKLRLGLAPYGVAVIDGTRG
ncbi:MAG: hypothetical protein M3Y37_03950 [Chloroflexota bacterium]|nr:hypothetical protein [Chloroflexota bacterium]